MTPVRKQPKRGGDDSKKDANAAIKAHDDAVYYSGVYWNDYPVVVKHINETISGHARIDWFKYFKKSQKGRVFKKALILNCGNGWVEREFYKLGLFEKAVGVDYSEGLLKEARKEAKKMPLRYYQMDINKVQFPEQDFDLIINNASAHHIANIDIVYQQLAHIMTDDGVFVNFDYVGPNRNQYPLWQWLVAKWVNRKLPKHLRQDMKYPHQPTMLVTDPSEAVHSELVLRSTRRYFKLTEHKRMGGPIAYLLLTHNENMQHASKKDVLTWSRFIMEKDNKVVRTWPPSSMFDYFVAVKKQPNFYTKSLHRWYAFKERQREKHAHARGGAYYPLRPKIMQRYTIWKEKRRLKRLEQGRSEQSIFTHIRQLVGKAVVYVRTNGFKKFFAKVLLDEPGLPALRVFRHTLTGVVVSAIAVTVGLLMNRILESNKYGLMFGVLAGAAAAMLCAAVLASPERTKQYITKQRYTLAALIVCLLFFCLGFITLVQAPHLSKTNGLSITFDEVSFIPSGYYYQSNGKNFLSPDHPPLVKDIGALPLAFMDLKQPPEKSQEVLLQDFVQHLWGKELLYEANPGKTERIIVLARTSVLATNALLIFVIFLSLAKVWSKRTAFLAVFLIATSQFMLAHSMLVTMDAMAGYLSILALIWSGIWMHRYIDGKSAAKPAVIAAIFLAGSLVSKSSAILLIPFFVVASLIYLVLFWKRIKGRRVRFIASTVAIPIMTFAFVSIWYAWHVRNMSASDVAQQLQTSYQLERYPDVGRDVIEKVAEITVFGRGFAEYVHGMLIVNNRIYKGGFTYIFYDHYYGPDEPQPLYFPLLYFAKQQVIYHLLSLLALAAGAYALVKRGVLRTARTVFKNPEALLVASYCLLFMAIAAGSTLLIGLRHVFPVVVGAAIMTALGVGYVLDKAYGRFRFIRPAVLAACTVIVVSTLLSFPYYISYYNFLVGGTDNGYKIAVDSNYDWGQDLKLLEKWRQDNNVDKLYIDLHINPFIPINYYFGSSAEWYRIENEDKPLPSGSYIAVSAEILQKNKYKGLPADKQYSQFEKNQVARVGKTIFVFRVL